MQAQSEQATARLRRGRAALAIQSMFFAAQCRTLRRHPRCTSRTFLIQGDWAEVLFQSTTTIASPPTVQPTSRGLKVQYSLSPAIASAEGSSSALLSTHTGDNHGQRVRTTGSDTFRRQHEEQF